MMNLNLLKPLAASVVGAVLVSVVGGVQSAEAVTINFGGANATAPSFSDSVGGIGYTATGFSSNPFNSNDRNVVRRGNGLGVQLSGLLSELDDPEVDGFGFNETLRITFDQIVKLTSATFARVGLNDEVTFSADNLSAFFGDIPGGNLGDNAQGTIAPLSSIGTTFDFTVTDIDDDFFLKSVDVEPVPEPLTILGSLAAVGIGTALKKKQAQQNLKG